MAQIYKRKGSRYWAAGWYDAQGKFHLRSTKQLVKNKAMAVALEFERADRLARESLLTEQQARKVLSDIMARVGCKDTLRSPATDVWLKEWVRNKSERYNSVINGFFRSLGQRAKQPLAATTAQDVDDYIEQLKTCRAGKTVTLALATLRSAFKKAHALGLMAHNPALAVDMPEIERIERQEFTPDEVAQLINAADGEWKTLILLGYHTGARITALTTLEWGQIDLARGIIDLPPMKRGRRVLMPIHPQLHRALSALPKTNGHLLPKLAPIDSGGKLGLSETFKKIAAKAGVDLKPVEKPSGRMELLRPFHSLRHTLTSALANSGVPSEIRKRLTGHRSDQSHDVYVHWQKSKLAEALAKTPDLPL